MSTKKQRKIIEERKSNNKMSLPCFAKDSAKWSSPVGKRQKAAAAAAAVPRRRAAGCAVRDAAVPRRRAAVAGGAGQGRPTAPALHAAPSRLRGHPPHHAKPESTIFL